MRTRTNRRRTKKKQLKLPKLNINWRRIFVATMVPLVAVAGWFALEHALDRPVERLAIEGPFQRVTAVQVEAVVGPQIGRGFLSVDLDDLREQLEALDWVERAVVWRRWPATLSVRIAEHTAAARWGSHGLLNVSGELFTEDARHAYPELPLLEGPPGTERRVAELYLAIRDRLADAQLQMTALQMDDRGALSFRLYGGQEVRVGRESLEERLDRFFAIATPAVVRDMEEIAFVDLRYSNGFSVGWREHASALAANVEQY